MVYFNFEEQGEAVAFLADALNSLLQRESQATVALVAKNKDVAQRYYESLKHANVPKLHLVRQQDFNFKPGIEICDVFQIKGLEYDYIIALETTAQEYTSSRNDRHLLHVVATRAIHQLWLISSSKPSPILPQKLVETGLLDLSLE